MKPSHFCLCLCECENKALPDSYYCKTCRDEMPGGPLRFQAEYPDAHRKLESAGGEV